MSWEETTFALSYEYWYIAKPETSTDDNGLIVDLTMSWEEVAQFASDEDLYDMYEGSMEELGDAFSDYDNARLIDRIVYSNLASLTNNAAPGVTAFKIVQKAFTTPTSGFAVGYEFGGVNRPWFKDEVVVNSDKRDYAAGYGDESRHLKFANETRLSHIHFKELFDRRPLGLSFTDTYNNLVDTYVKNIYGTLGDLKVPSLTYKQSTKRTQGLKNTSTFELNEFEQTGVDVATSTVTTTLTTGGY